DRSERIAPVTTAADTASSARAGGAMLVLLTLASGQFLMTLDSSVMNVSIATVAKDVGTTVTGIQGAITAYTLVMAALMITGAKIGAIIGRKRAFAIGCVIYGCGSLTTSIAQSLPVLLFGWSFLEGVGAALIMPAIVALVAGNFPAERRPAAYGLVAAAGAVAVAVGPLIGGFCTTYFSWRWVFAGEVVVVLAILLLTRRIADAPVEKRPQLDVVGAVLSALGLGLLVFGVLRSSEWGWIQPKTGGPSWAGLSPTIWLIIGGLFVIWVFFRWQARRESHGQEPLVRTAMLRNKQLTGGLTMFFFQFLVQAGFFFVVPLFLSVALGLSAIDTGVRLLPLSVTLLAAAIGIPKLFPSASPRLVVRLGLLSLLAGTVVLLGGLDPDAGAEIVFVPMLLVGFGIGALSSQLGAVTVSAVPDDQSPEVGGVQNTMTNLGASLGTALAGSLLIATLSSSFLTNVQQSQAIPASAKEQAQVELAGGIPFISDADLEAALDEAGASSETTDAAVDANADARLDGLRSALAILAVLAVLALFLAQSIPTRPPGSVERRE
ncbi:MAG TPA: MFS transporter, partial [Gaiellaceae bacterium]|nr:MFS transporter [Gaiellaceae bacterium]